MKNKLGYYSADSIRGILFHGKDFVDYDNLIRPIDFYKDLSVIDEDTIYTYIDFEDEDILRQIEAEYTIK